MTLSSRLDRIEKRLANTAPLIAVLNYDETDEQASDRARAEQRRQYASMKAAGALG